jgi:hypothetical protein
MPQYRRQLPDASLRTNCERTESQITADAKTLGLLQEFQSGVYSYVLGSILLTVVDYVLNHVVGI